jgi:hypothetical protein
MRCDTLVEAGQAPATRPSLPRVPAMQIAFPVLLGLCLLALVCIVSAIAGDAVKPLGPIKFNIAAQPMSDALQAYSIATGAQVLFETSSVDDYRCVPVQGEFTADAALQMMLANTDLKVRYTRASAITIVRASDPDADEPPEHALASADFALNTLNVNGGTPAGDRNRMDEYIGTVQADIQRALKRTARGRVSEYRAEVKLWVDQSRTVQRAELSRSSGNKDRDTIVVSTLQGLVLSQPAPTNTPQPIRFMISIRSL